MVETYIAAAVSNKRRRVGRALVAAILAMPSCRSGSERAAESRAAVAARAPFVEPAELAPPAIQRGERFIVAAAGDIAGSFNEQTQTAALLLGTKRRGRLAAILPLGDLQYPYGELRDFRAHYARSWGLPSLRALTRPVPGNHEYALGRSDADGYFDYWNGVGAEDGPAGRRGEGHYSYDIGDWHFVALNTSDGCRKVSCAAGGPMHTWLVTDLAKTDRRCVLAYWHHPRFHLGGTHGDEARVAPLWDALYDAGADVVLNGHEHNFQAIAPLDKAGRVDPGRGIRSFVVGTGGAKLYSGFRGGGAGGALEAGADDDHGVLELELGPGGFAYAFRAVDGTPDGAVKTRGQGVCH